MDSSSAVGTNLYENVYYSAEFPFLNRMKSASQWIAQGGDQSLIPLTADGYPTGSPPGTTSLYTMVGLDPVATSSNNTYVLTWTGSAAFFIAGAQIISSAPGKIIFNFTRTDTNQTFISVGGLDASNPLDNMALVRSDQVDLYNSGEIFNPAFISKVSQLDTLRYMDWSSTNSNQTKNWADRTMVSDMTWQSNLNSTVPLEVEVALANESKTNMWLNVPTYATDDYVRQMVAYVHDHLDPSLTLHLEYSNEVWNFGFQQATNAKDQADKLWGTDANHDGVIDSNDPAEHVGNGWVLYYGYRAAQIASIANQVYGADSSRLSNVLATQTVWVTLSDWITEGIAKANVGSVSSLFKEYAVTTYFDGMLRGANDADRATILSWAKSGDAGLTAAFAALKNGTGLSADDTGSLAYLRGILVAQDQRATSLGLKMVGYEGGVDLTQGLDAYGADKATVAAFLNRLHADPRMGDIYTQMVKDFSAAGGTLLNSYTDVGIGYGTLASIYDTGSPEWNALVAAQAAAEGAVVTTPVTTTPVTSTPVTTTPVTTAPVTTTPVTTTPVTTAPVTTTPVTTTPVTTAPVTTTPVITTPVTTPVTIPVTTTPVASTPLEVAPVATSGTTRQANYTMSDGEKVIAFVGTGTFSANGNDLDNTITAGDGGSTLNGGGGADVLIGGAGADYLDGGTGADTMTGGAGDDTYVVDSTGDQVIEAAGGGVDTVRTTLASYALPDQLEKLVYAGTGNFAGTGHDGGISITGGAGADTLVGGAGDDMLDGSAGDDVMKGGLGNDIYFVDSAADQVIEAAGQGTDEVRTTLATYTLGDNVENLSYTGTGKFSGAGNALDNVITAGAGVGTLSGGAGSDTLLGGAGDDYLDGGSGMDRMVGGSGNDTYVVDDLRDQVVEAAGGGSDTVLTSLSTYLLPDQVENLTYIGSGSLQAMGNESDNVITGGNGIDRLLGGGGNDTLVGGSANDVLDGGSGADRMVGGAGDDIYFVDDAGDQVVENAGGGNDTVYSMVSFTLSANVEKLQLIGMTATVGTGNELDNIIIGNDAGDRLVGGAGNDTLTGGAGDDVLVGDSGADTLTGGAGADRFTFSLGDLSSNPANTDTITDFSRNEGDRIDLSGYRGAGSSAFTFLGTGGFTNHADELRLDTSGTNQIVYGDLNGDGVADFALNVSKGAGALIASDFVL